MTGLLNIIELREKAKKAFQRWFSIRELHDVVLRAGMVPLELIEREADA